MTKIIVDLQNAEAYSLGLKDSSNSSNTTTRYKKNIDSLYLYYSSILKHYGISFNDFNLAINWYKHHPSQMDSVLSRSLEMLHRQQAKLGLSARIHLPDHMDSTNANRELIPSQDSNRSPSQTTTTPSSSK